MSIRFVPLWFDSMGSKSSSIYIETDDVRILVDPGISGLQPGFPIPDDWKAAYNMMGWRMINKFAGLADITIITHYHYDHLEMPTTKFIDPNKLYGKKIILLKDPNKYINASQHERARLFLASLIEHFLGKSIDDYKTEPKDDFEDPLNWISLALEKDFGDYNRRRKEILEKGRERFEKLCDLWRSSYWIREINERNLRVEFADGREYVFGRTKMRFTKPMFHGIEYDRLGWVIGFVVECENSKLLFTSDVQGPFIEDYAEWIIRESPNIAIIDGPPTYQLGYMLTLTNLRRAIDNIIRILNEGDIEMIIWDHHLLRDVRWSDRVKEVYDLAKKKKKKIITAAEYYGKRPVAELARRMMEKKQIRKNRYIIPPVIS